ncbi:peptidylprolyl isomerase [Modestobacter roseus]|uniref:Peptidyl-prolyl cis-trans isomerase B (Cyclophilin B) n=1 Tax=Modestobacter roseus TaxID=1181884 RepID=A0A562INK7_9ACTN|nr:peptidylprolyl isomerase [Modestobacter roseus]MQA34162.1 peptidylprolyl isomerase [Modestobacter roseus]TWH72482.1 peptidyl-prolyl cis-trans isomerase B (cyclophilin B) [Modestobacter roseus]
MPTNKQRREAAQRHLQRQLERREQLARKRRRNALIGVTVIAVLAVVAAVFIITGITGEDDTTDTASGATDTTTAPVVDGSDGTCDFVPDTSGSDTLTDVGIPPAEVPTTGTTGLTLATSAGDIGLTLDQANAPCASASMVYLAQQGFFDDTPCHRLTSGGLSVLQCGDPSGTGTGGPTYDFPTQVTGSETYPRGTLAMANAGQGTDASQFFLVYADSQLQPDYTVVGTIDEAGLATLDAIAAAGIEGGASDGAPATPVTIDSATVAAP